MRWLQYKRKFAHGIDRNWAWLEIGDTEDDLQEALEEVNREYDWSDKYRGIDYEVVPVPPVEVLEAEIKSHKEKAKGHEASALRLEAVLFQVRKATSSKRKKP